MWEIINCFWRYLNENSTVFLEVFMNSISKGLFQKYFRKKNFMNQTDKKWLEKYLWIIFIKRSQKSNLAEKFEKLIS